MAETVFKILRRDEFAAARAQRHYAGTPDDLRDGFIHLSTADQVAGTLAKHFSDERDLVLLAFDAWAFGDALKWQPSRGGALFPHLSEPLDLDLALWQRPIANADGRHILPPIDPA